MSFSRIIEILSWQPTTNGRPDYRCTSMLEAEDVNACYQAMKKKDWLIFLEDLADRPYGIRCFRLLDPNKNDIVIFSYLKDLEEKGLL